MLDVLDGEPEGLNLGESLARWLEEGEALPQLLRTVHQLPIKGWGQRREFIFRVMWVCGKLCKRLKGYILVFW